MKEARVPNKILKKLGKGRKRKPVKPYTKEYIDVYCQGVINAGNRCGSKASNGKGTK